MTSNSSKNEKELESNTFSENMQSRFLNAIWYTKVTILVMKSRFGFFV